MMLIPMCKIFLKYFYIFSGKMHISVKILKRKFLPLFVTKDDSVLDIKRRIEVKESIDINHQSLFYDGNPLENDRTLDDYFVEEEATLYLYLRGNN